MGYLDNSSVTVDAVLTKLGRQRLAEGNLNITKFALGDDEINYAMYDTSHTLGTAFYGEAIERLPLLEAFTNDTQALTNKLVTLPKNTQILPVVTIAQSSISLTTPGQTVVLSPQTLNITGANSTGYTFILGNSDIVQMSVDQAGSGTGASATGYQTMQTGDQLAGTANAMSVTLTAIALTQTQTTTLTITGIDTGGTVTVPITVAKDPSLD